MCKISNTSEFIRKSKSVYQDTFSYEKTIYTNCSTKLIIICKEHGEFLVTPSYHLYGYGCGKCSRMKFKNSKLLSQEEFIKRAISKHGKNKFDYSLVEYKGSDYKVNIQCLTCKSFFLKNAASHLFGSGCTKCSNRKMSTIRKYTKAKFIEKSILTHGESRYDYTLSDYINNEEKVQIKCNKCKNIFLQVPRKHIEGRGCPECCESKGEKLISKWLNSNYIKYESQKKFNKCLSPKNNQLRFDFYLPNYNILIEFDGAQHFKVVEHFGGVKELIYRQLLDCIKMEFALNNRIKLIRISYKDKNNINKILKSEIN